jgi:EAL domain-containing protein (putative c-di-GMP-specific phosphodiesterase class I)
MHNVQEALARLTSLKELGVHLAVDDFGTGYSSLSYLHQFPVDTVKIDKAFIGRANSGGDDTKFLEAILSLGDALHLHTLAEGIETAGQAETLERLGCRLGQGFHYARPLSSDAVRLFLEGQPAAALAETNSLAAGIGPSSLG